MLLEVLKYRQIQIEWFPLTGLQKNKRVYFLLTTFPAFGAGI